MHLHCVASLLAPGRFPTGIEFQLGRQSGAGLSGRSFSEDGIHFRTQPLACFDQRSKQAPSVEEDVIFDRPAAVNRFSREDELT